MNLTDLKERAKDVALFLTTPFAEKDNHKTEHLPIDIVLSASRIVLYVLVGTWVTLGFKLLEVRPEVLGGWPFWTAGVILGLSLPVSGALKAADPEKVLTWAKGVMENLGEGD